MTSFLYAPVLGGYTLPHPSAYEEEDMIRGSSVIMSDGRVVFQKVTSSDTKREFSLTWEVMTISQLVTLRSAFGSIATTYTTNNFTSIFNAPYTVTRHPEQKSLKLSAVKAGTDIRWKVNLKLREV